MKNNPIKQIISILLALVMLVGLLPTAAIPVFAEETTYTKAGEVGAVTAECEAFTEPELGAVIKGRGDHLKVKAVIPGDQLGQRAIPAAVLFGWKMIIMRN